MSRATKAAVIARVDIVYRLLRLGLDRPQILEHVAKKYAAWACSASAVDRYIAKAKQLILDQLGVEIACAQLPWNQDLYRYVKASGATGKCAEPDEDCRSGLHYVGGRCVGVDEAYSGIPSTPDHAGTCPGHDAGGG